MIKAAEKERLKKTKAAEKELVKMIKAAEKERLKVTKAVIENRDIISDDDIMSEKCGQQSQRHGFVFENDIRTKVFKLDTVDNDTNKHDIPKDKNIFDSNENISIKMTGKNDISCGDILRFYDYRFDEKNTMIVGKYSQKENEKKIEKIFEINYDQKMRDVLFGSVSRDELASYVSMIKALQHGKISKTTREHFIKNKKDIETKHDMKIQISPKVDSKNQRRVQCRIPNITDLMSILPDNFTITVDTVRGVKIQTTMCSGKRIRHSKRLDSSV